MAYRIKESKFPDMKEEYRIIMQGATEEMLNNKNIQAELATLDLLPGDLEFIEDNIKEN